MWQQILNMVKLGVLYLHLPFWQSIWYENDLTINVLEQPIYALPSATNYLINVVI